MSEEEMIGWCPQCNGHELGQTLRDGVGQRGLVCYSPWGCKESDMTGKLKYNVSLLAVLSISRLDKNKVTSSAPNSNRCICA